MCRDDAVRAGPFRVAGSPVTCGGRSKWCDGCGVFFRVKTTLIAAVRVEGGGGGGGSGRSGESWGEGGRGSPAAAALGRPNASFTCVFLGPRSDPFIPPFFLTLTRRRSLPVGNRLGVGNLNYIFLFPMIDFLQLYLWHWSSTWSMEPGGQVCVFTYGSIFNRTSLHRCTLKSTPDTPRREYRRPDRGRNQRR